MEKRMKIEGMSCDHCATRIEEKLSQLDGIYSIKVDLENKEAILKINKSIENATLKKIVEDLGYIVKEIREI